MNLALRSALNDAGMSQSELAYRVGVSAKQVQRWLSDAELRPHAINRADAARALGVDEDMIWPKAVRDRVKTGGDREILRTYPYRSACPSTVWAELAAGAQRELLLAGFTNYFFWPMIPAFSALIRRKAEAGCRVRVLLGDPAGEVTRQREVIEDVPLSVSTRIRMTLGELDRLGHVEGLEARFSAAEDAVNHVSLSVFRFDEQALVTPHLARLVGHDSPLLHLKRHTNDGMFARFAEHAEELWGRAIPVQP